MVCWVCCGIARRRFRGWKVKEIQQHLLEDVPEGQMTHRARFDAWRQNDINFILANGFITMTNHMTDGGVGVRIRSHEVCVLNLTDLGVGIEFRCDKW